MTENDLLTYQIGLFDDHKKGYCVKQIPTKDTYDFIKKIHYAHRVPSISYAFGLYYDGDLVGIVTYGTPASSTLCRGICKPEFQKEVLELNRLVLKNNKKNEGSRLVGASFKLLPKPKIIVSFADTAQNHCGTVYQATNFVYTGLSALFRDPKVKGLEHQHHATYARGLTNKQVIEKYGAENVYFEERSRKHRYIKFLGTKKQIVEMQKKLKYKILPYPKHSL